MTLLPSLTLREKIYLLFLILGLAISSTGFIYLWYQTNTLVNQSQELPLETYSADQALGTLFIDVGGAVKNPGIYSLHTGDRLAQAISAAGGFHEKADKTYISKNVNLSKTLTDGEKVYIHFENELVSTSVANTNETNVSGISLNSATQTELETLEGIGVKRAEDIIANRPYSTIEEIVSKNVITQTQFEKLKNSLKL